MVEKKPFLYSKTNLKKNEQCSLQFYNEINHPELKRYPKNTLKAFSIGNEIDEEAKKLIPEAIDIKDKGNWISYEKTLKALKQSKPILQASFIRNEVVVRTDAFIPNMEGVAPITWKIVEVKASTKIKQDFLDDVTIQYWTANTPENPINKVEIWTVNNKDKNGGLFKVNDLTKQVRHNKGRYLELIAKAKATKALDKAPPPNYGSHCEGCPFRWKCFEQIDQEPTHVVNIPRFDKKWEALNSGITTIHDPKFSENYQNYLTQNHTAIEAIQKNTPLMNIKALKNVFNKLKPPYRFFDIESVGYPLPFIEKTMPYHQVLALYNIETIDEDKTTSSEWMLDTVNPDWDKVSKKLVEELGEVGSILVWGKAAEVQALRNLQYLVKDNELKKSLQKIQYRFIDLYEIFANHIYSPELMGELGLKNVARVILKKDLYKSLSVQDGSQVSEAFRNFLFETDLIKKEDIKKDLIDYNKVDVHNTKNLFYWVISKIKIQK